MLVSFLLLNAVPRRSFQSFQTYSARGVTGLFALCLVVSVGLCLDAQEANQIREQATETSVLESEDAGANGAASVERPDVNSLAPSNLNAMSSAPSVPRGILVPRSPTEETFTESSADSGIGTESVPANGGSSKATETFAVDDPVERQTGPPPVNPKFSASPANTYPSNSNPAISSQSPGLVRAPITQNNLRGSATSSKFGDAKSAAANPPPVMQLGDSNGSNQRPGMFKNPELPVQRIPSQRTLAQPIPKKSSFSAEAIPKSVISHESSPAFNAQAVDRTVDTGNSVQPTGFNQATTVRQTPPTKLARQLMDRYRVSNAPDPLPGRPTTMLEMLRQPISPPQRKAMVRRYWETYFDWATLLSRAQHSRWLNSIPNPGSQVETALLEAAKAAAKNQVLAAEIQLGKSQSLLMDFIPNQPADLKPIPSDQPIVERYSTNYDVYQKRGLIPGQMRGINEMLPKSLELISYRAETVRLAESAANKARNGMTNRQPSLVSVMEAARIWRRAEQDLISSVVSYNQAIGDYSLTTFGRFNQSPEQIVSTLIARPKPVNDPIANRNVGRPQGRITGGSPAMPSRYTQPGTERSRQNSSALSPNPNARQGQSINSMAARGFGGSNQSSPPPTSGPSGRTANASGFSVPGANNYSGPSQTGIQPGRGTSPPPSNSTGGSSFGGNSFGGNSSGGSSFGGNSFGGN